MTARDFHFPKEMKMQTSLVTSSAQTPYLSPRPGRARCYVFAAILCGNLPGGETPPLRVLSKCVSHRRGRVSRPAQGERVLAAILCGNLPGGETPPLRILSKCVPHRRGWVSRPTQGAARVGRNPMWKPTGRRNASPTGSVQVRTSP